MQAITVRDPTDVASARRRVVGLAADIGYDETQAGRVAIVVTELAQNLLRHGGGGEILAQADPHRPAGIEIVALDHGPGMADVAACLHDGFSTSGTSGNGLGAIHRLTHHLLIHSSNAGTAVLARMGTEEASEAAISRTAASLCIAQPGESVCGDSAAIVTRQDGSIGILLADGLGHGPLAAAASQEAVRLFQKHPDTSPAEALNILHDGLRPTRGAAAAAAVIDRQARRVTYSGVGNIAGFITDTGGTRRLVSLSGTVGHIARRMQEFHYPIFNRPCLVMFSDGLASSWSPESHPNLFMLDPTLIASVLYRDHQRGRDDASVLVWKD